MASPAGSKGGLSKELADSLRKLREQSIKKRLDRLRKLSTKAASNRIKKRAEEISVDR